MIPDSKKTVFVLGAGASIPYSYPSGIDLLKILANTNSNDRHFRVAVRQRSSREEIERFCSILKEAAPPSIDHFLERRPEFERLGKLLIAELLLEGERASLNSLPGLLGNNEHWCSKVFDKLSTPDFESLHFRNVKFITFNYDRSLEHCFFRMLSSRYQKNEELIADKIKELEVLHVYGSIGDLDWQKVGGRSYGANGIDQESPEWDRLTIEASNGIRIISNVRDGDETTETLQKCRIWLNEANRIILLGMAYHQENMTRLGFPLPKVGARTLIEGSGFGLTELEKEHFEGAFGISIGETTHTNGKFLRHCRNFISL